MIGVFTVEIDAAQMLVVAFVLFFFGLVFYLRREDKREGYPLEDDAPGVRHPIVGFPDMPAPKTYLLMDGSSSTLPKNYGRREIKARPRGRFPGAALYPVGEPLLAGVGPGAYTLRQDRPFSMPDGSPQLQPLRVATDYKNKDPDMEPRGRRVFGADMVEAGICVDLWIDKGSKILRYIEIELSGGAGRRLVPIFSAVIRRNAPHFVVDAVKAAQLALAPVLRDPTTITAREEDFVNGFFAGGSLYSTPMKDAVL